jgi:hypothetical protein
MKLTMTDINTIIVSVAAVMAAAAAMLGLFHTIQLRIEVNHRLDQLLRSRYDAGVTEGKAQEKGHPS